MKTFKPLSLGILCRPIEFQRRFFLGVAATTFCPIGETPGILGDIAMWKFLGEALPPGMPLDMALPKTAAEFLANGSAFAPGGRPAQAVPVSIRLGTLTKRLMAVGDRHFEDGRPTPPKPFTEMPMGWERAYGGAKLAENPLGRGLDEMPLPGIGFRVALPNVIPAEGDGQRRAPVPLGFGPIDIAWPQRSKLAGTHNQRWLEEDFPGFARDIDWRILMAASPDQRFAGFLRGDEDYAIENMHPTEPQLTGRLPAVMPRILINRRGRTGLEDVPLSLSTVWFFPNAKRLVMIHHGRVRVEEEDARDVERLLLGCDRLGTPRPIGDFEAVMAKRSHPKYGPMMAILDSDLVPAELILPDPDIEAMKAAAATQGLAGKRLRRRREIANDKAREDIRAQGRDPDLFIPTMPAEEPLPSLEQIPARIEAAEKEGERRRAAAEVERAASVASINYTLKQLNLPPQEPMEDKGRGPPTYTAAGKKRELEALLAQLEGEGQDSSIVRDLIADSETCEKVEEASRNAYRMGAHHQYSAHPLSREANVALRAWLFDGRRAARRANLCGADLAGADLSGFDLSEAWLDGADLTGANLTHCVLERAVLAHAKLDGARMAGAKLKEASLGRASLRGADLSAADLRQALMHGADLTDAVMRRAQLSDAALFENELSGIDMSDAVAQRLLVNKAKIMGLRAAGANLDGAMFVQCELPGADFTGAQMRSVTFITAVAPGICFAGADLSKAICVESCDFTGGNFTGANCTSALLRGARLSGADFAGALLDGADLSEADLAGASLDLVRAKEARFMVTNLAGARLTRADFKDALFSRADLRGADLSDSSLYGADLGRIHADEGTRYARVQRTRTKLVPRRTPT